MSGGNFACRITEADYVGAFGPPQPEEVEVGQDWMNARTGTVLPVKRVRDDEGGPIVDLGGEFFTVVLSAKALREGWVCVDAPNNVRAIGRTAPSEGQRT